MKWKNETERTINGMWCAHAHQYSTVKLYVCVFEMDTNSTFYKKYVD